MRDESTELMRARSAGIATKEVGGEVVVYDLETDKVHLLNPVTSTIWRLASEGDGVTTEAATAAVTAAFPDQDAPGDLTLAALQELRAAGLLLSATGAPSFGLDRRRMLKIAGGAAVLGPLVTTILAPPAAAHESGTIALGEPCDTGHAHACVGGVCSGTDSRCGNCQSLGTSCASTRCCQNVTGTICRSSTCCIIENQTGSTAQCCSGFNRVDTVGNNGFRAGGGGTLGQCCTPAGTVSPNTLASECCSNNNTTTGGSPASRCCWPLDTDTGVVSSGGSSVTDLRCCKGTAKRKVNGGNLFCE
ncbi:MAG TPA: PqqD family peptide modification chaperone [Acidimicrobiales bacterium]|nr:PqqD family peptide modification chaperone [Acidimicrobiales bacterium]